MSLEEAKNEKGAIKDEIIVLKREIGENYEEDLLKIYNNITQNPGDKRVILLIKTPFNFLLKIHTNLYTNLIQ
jgi:DNA polymerase-3 subunit alpha